MQRITSAHNPRLKSAIRLHEARGRRQQNRILITGAREIERALTSGLEVCELFVCEQLLSDEQRAVAARLPSGAAVLDLPAQLLARLAYGERAEPMVAVAYRPDTTLQQAANRRDMPPNPLIAIVHSIEKPGNLGAVIRSADAAAVDLIIVTDPICDPLHPNSIRASMGAVFAVPLAVTSAEETIAWLVDRDITMYTAEVGSNTRYTDADFTTSAAIVIGNESVGLGSSWQYTKRCAISIPMHGIGDSLNLSVTAAILFYEARRQRSMLSS